MIRLRRLARLPVRLLAFCLWILDFFLIIFRGRRIERRDDLACIVRIDAIGDYILFRQALRSLCFSPRLAGKKIVLCGNAVWRELAVHLDADCFDDFISVDRCKFNASPVYRVKTLLTLKRLGAAIALHPTFSREYMGDILIAATEAREKIGFRSLPQNIAPALKYITDKFYTELVAYPETYPFELMRNQEFLRYLGVPEQDMQPFHLVQKPCLNSDAQGDLRMCRNLPVFFIGASEPHKRWPVACWLELANRLAQDYGLTAVWTGGQDCKDDMRKIAARLPVGSHNLVGNTSLTELLHIIADARLVVANDSMGPHFAAMLAIPHVVISNGQHLGRFLPYPTDMAPQGFAVYPNEINSASPNNIRKYYIMPKSPFPMSSISVERVYTTLARILKQHVDVPIG